jgi:hypothetical protein
MGGFGRLIGFSALFVLWRFLSIIGGDVGLFTNGGGFGHRRCFCGGHGAWCGDAGLGFEKGGDFGRWWEVVGDGVVVDADGVCKIKQVFNFFLPGSLFHSL